MTEVKAFVNRDESPYRDRKIVAALLIPKQDDVAFSLPTSMEPLGPTTLFDLALDCLSRIAEAEERIFWSDDPTCIERFETSCWKEVRRLSIPLERALLPGRPDSVHSTHVLRLDGRHPFLRPNTLDEAIRLLKVREDIEAITACVRVKGELFSHDGQSVALSMKRPMLLSCGAFEIEPGPQFAHGLARQAAPLAFEISPSEAFRVESVFSQQLAGAFLDARKGSVVNDDGG
jgi:hypothetical protein